MLLGNKNFPTPLIQGPLAGVSCAPFRRLTWRYSQPAFSCTEMISCKTLIHQSIERQQRFVQKDPEEGPVCFQLASSDPHELAIATKRVTDYGADLIDLNCGCPVKKIRSRGAGSRLLTNASKIYQLILAMKKNTHVPVSVKIRVENPGSEKFHHELVAAISDAGADFAIVHGRHWSENYETPCRYDAIRFFVEQLKIPVIGNGDIACVDSLKKMLATGCAGVMIARAGVGQPWLIGQLTAALQEKEFVIPTPSERGEIFIEHIESLCALLKNEKFAILQARKMAKYYARNLDGKDDFCSSINVCDNLKDFKATCQTYFNNF
jgi:tRNA-dihydrouridine synthase B